MRASSFFQLASLSPLALGLVVPKDVTPEQLDELIARREVDPPDHPRVDIGKDGCFRVEKVDEREVRSSSFSAGQEGLTTAAMILTVRSQEFKDCEPKKFLEEDGTCKVHASENEVSFPTSRSSIGPPCLERKLSDYSASPTARRA